MRTLEECRAEVFRRSQIKLAAKRARRRRVLLLGTLTLVIIALLLAALLPAALKNAQGKNDGSNDGSSSGTTVPMPDSPPNGGHNDSLESPEGSEPEYIIAAVDLMNNVTANKMKADPDYAQSSQALASFSMELFRNCLSAEGNTLISPVSIIYALAMTANGAEGETRAQMESVLGMSVEELNRYLNSYRQSVSKWDRNTLHLANSIWFKFTPTDAFLQNIADYYGADAFSAPFDHSTVDDINYWVEKHTNGMIPELVDEMNENSMMALVNALAFEAEWADPYSDYQVKDGIFTAGDGSEQSARFMEEELDFYIEDNYARGFVKYYEGNRFVFVALLPDEGVSIEQYVATLDADSLQELFNSASAAHVYTKLPKFTTGSDCDFAEVLYEMGITKAFSSYAEFTELCPVPIDGPVHIGDVIQKTYITLNEDGTSAGAGSMVGMEGDGIDDFYRLPIVRIELDRPFVYMIVDRECMLPIMIGSLTSVEG